MSSKEVKAEISAEVLLHERNCWIPSGQAGLMRKDVADIKAWGKAFGIIFLALQTAMLVVTLIKSFQPTFPAKANAAEVTKEK